MKTQTKLVIGLVVAIIAVVIASQSATRTAEIQKRNQMKAHHSSDLEKGKLKPKQEAIRDISSGSENIR